MSLSTRYSPEEIEDKWYKHWDEMEYFYSTPNDKEAYSIVIPPPNVTGVLHMGHMLNNTIQDILIRKARLDGKNACWVPGTDHASIATEAKVVRMLREKGIKKSDLSREEFLEHAWQWKEQYGGIILNQLKKLGASADWRRTAFTMDESRSAKVIQAFVDLHNRGKLYRGLRMVNWDPQAQTVLSNEEVLYEEEQSNLYHLSYKIDGTNDSITIATTRPETILGDSAIAVHPDDERYAHLKGKSAIVPLINRKIPIIFDDYVDTSFGTGALKVTPAHDINDYEIGKRHSLEVIDILNDNGSISEAGTLYIGMDRFEVRKQIKIDLKEAGHLVEIKSHMHNVGRSERTNAVIEPKLSLQWYVNMKSISEPALEAVMNDTIKFFPQKYKNTYNHWMSNIRDWCISRQLWWGQRIPAYYYENEVFVASTSEEALALAKEKFPNITPADLKQDEDVLDTWFSSWLWPMSVFEKQEDLDYYYPTNVLVTGWDIIFLWVARMVMAGYEWKNELPFESVYFTGMVRDKQKRKMSKSLGNSPDALQLIKDFGADGVRFGMLSCSPAGGDLLFEEKLVEQGRNFCNKLWNMLRLIQSWEVDKSLDTPESNLIALKWYDNQLNKVVTELEDKYKDYKLSEVLISLYSLVWNDFASWLLEMIKPDYQKPVDRKTLGGIKALFEKNCIILHPFMPFITEEIWHQLKERKEGDDCMMSTYPANLKFDSQLIDNFDLLKTIVSKIRDIKNQYGVSQNDKLDLFAVRSSELDQILNDVGLTKLVHKMGNISSIEIVDQEPEGKVAMICGASKLFIDIGIEIDVESELKKLREELQRQEGFVTGVQKKLSNERFVQNAAEEIVNRERQKLNDGETRIEQIKASIASLVGS